MVDEDMKTILREHDDSLDKEMKGEKRKVKIDWSKLTIIFLALLLVISSAYSTAKIIDLTNRNTELEHQIDKSHILKPGDRITYLTDDGTIYSCNGESEGLTCNVEKFGGKTVKPSIKTSVPGKVTHQ